MRINKREKLNRTHHSRRTKIALIAGAVVLVAIVAAAVGISALIAHHKPQIPAVRAAVYGPQGSYRCGGGQRR